MSDEELFEIMTACIAIVHQAELIMCEAYREHTGDKDNAKKAIRMIINEAAVLADPEDSEIVH